MVDGSNALLVNNRLALELVVAPGKKLFERIPLESARIHITNEAYL